MRDRKAFLVEFERVSFDAYVGLKEFMESLFGKRARNSAPIAGRWMLWSETSR
jgi:hypothetical protein